MKLRQEIGRKLIHLSSIWMVFIIYFLEKEEASIFFGGLLTIFFIFEYLRMSNNIIADITCKYFSKIMRSHENIVEFKFRGLTGSFFFLLAVFLSVLIFSKEVAISSILILIFADTMAALVGKYIGKRNILDKTAEGFIAFFITAVIILYFFYDIDFYRIVIIAFIVAFVELISSYIKINDNLSITITAGILTTILLI